MFKRFFNFKEWIKTIFKNEKKEIKKEHERINEISDIIVGNIMISMEPSEVYDILSGNDDTQIRSWIPEKFIGWVHVYVKKTRPTVTFINTIYAKRGSNSSIFITEQPYKILKDNETVGNIINGKVAFKFWYDHNESFTVDFYKYLLNDLEATADLEKSLNNPDIKIDYDKFKKGLEKGSKKEFWVWKINNVKPFTEPRDILEYEKLDKTCIKQAPKRFVRVKEI